MGISLKTESLKRYRDLALFLWKHGRSDMVRRFGMEQALEGEDVGPGAPAGADTERLSEQFVADLEKLGPTYVKLGQLLSSRSDLLPPPYIEALTRLQDKCEPFPFQEVEAIVAVELGVRLSKAFAEFDATPIAAASLGQVHRAVLRDGRTVAVKVQRPGIREQILADLSVLEEIAEFADAHTEAGSRIRFADMLSEFRKSLLRELDYRQEARNLTTLAENLREFDRIVVPLPIEDYSSGRVLTAQYVHGQKITSLHPVVRTDLDGDVLARQLFRAYLKQVLVDGFFHADPHPGNVFLTNDDRIALLDLGMVARVSPAMQEHLLRLLMAISEGRSEEAANAAIRIGEPLADFDETAFRRHIADFLAQNQDAQMGQIQIGRVMLVLNHLSVQCGIRIPSELTMLAKALLNLDEIGRSLAPQFDPNAEVRRESADILRKRMLKSISPAHFFDTLIEVKDFIERLPGRLNKVLDLAANNALKIDVDAIDEKLLMEGFQKVANRITLGLLLAALIVGAALLMRVQTSFTIFGYPGLAMICFLGAAAGGVMLMLSIVLSDHSGKWRLRFRRRRSPESAR